MHFGAKNLFMGPLNTIMKVEKDRKNDVSEM
jgi:hypothetical protein